jgi:hypothetical protein
MDYLPFRGAAIIRIHHPDPPLVPLDGPGLPATILPGCAAAGAHHSTARKEKRLRTGAEP